MHVSIKKTIALVIALFKLHNFCIDERDLVPPVRAIDELRTEMQGGVPLEAALTLTSDGRRVVLPRQLMDGGLHFDDVDRGYCRSRIRQYQSEADALFRQLPRDFLHDLVAEANLTRPVPRSHHRSS